MRVVADTNVIVSAFLSAIGAPARLLDLWRQGVFELLASEPILAEYRRALAYPKIQARHRLTDEYLDRLISEWRQFIILVEPHEVIGAISDDPSDNRFLECAVAGGADYVVSGDRHLLQLQRFRGIEILSPAAFVSVLRPASP
jgi:uncharacterized protein